MVLTASTLQPKTHLGRSPQTSYAPAYTYSRAPQAPPTEAQPHSKVARVLSLARPLPQAPDRAPNLECPSPHCPPDEKALLL